MATFFLQIVNMSIAAGWIVLAVVVLRLLLKKAPKWIAVLLWSIVAVRLVCPFSIESILSLLPSAETVSPTIMTDATPAIHSGLPLLNSVVNPVLQSSFAPDPNALHSANPLQIIVPVLSLVWIIGMAAMLTYTIISYLHIRHKVRTAVRLQENIFQSEQVISPFVLGFIRPKIYLPFDLKQQDLQHVIAHENAHISRKDHWWKPLGFLLLTLHWFNPLVWLAYLLLCNDIELACDEKVVKAMDVVQKADYSQALLTCSVNRRLLAACPLAFGEVGVKKRIKSVLHYKKPTFWLIIVAIITTLAVAVCFLTNPPTSENSSVSEIGGVDGPQNVTVTALEIQKLREKYPMYFEWDASHNLEIYIWQMSEENYSCVLLPKRSPTYTTEELWEYHKFATTMEEMRAIVAAAYIPPNHLDGVSIHPITMPHSSYAYTVDDAYCKKVTKLFWSSFPVAQVSGYSLLMDIADFDIDKDGKTERCFLRYGPTSGIFTFVFSVYEDNMFEYLNVFSMPHMDLRFEENDNGITQLVGTTDTTVRYMNMHVEDGNIVIESDEQDIAYWGTQGTYPPLIPQGNYSPTLVYETGSQQRSYYIHRNNIWETGGESPLFSVHYARLDHLQIHNGYLYFAVLYDGADEEFEICRMPLDGGEHTVIVDHTTFATKLSQHALRDFTVKNETLYIGMNFAFFSYDIQSKTATMVAEDAGIWQIHNDELYYIDHAYRTFTIYKTPLSGGEKQRVLGFGENEPTDKPLYKNFMFDGDTMYVYKRHPEGVTGTDGIYSYKNGTETLLVADTHINEFSIAVWKGKLYYVSYRSNNPNNETFCIYDLATGENEENCALPDFSFFIGVKNGYYFYEDGQEFTKSIALS